MMLEVLTSIRRQEGRWLRRLALLTTASSLVACASVPHRQSVLSVVPAAFTDRGGTPAADQWWQATGDSTLAGLIDAALSGNPGLQVAYARLAQAEASARRERATLFPSLTLQGAASRTEQSDDGPTRRDFTNLSSGAAASYELDLWGRLGSLREAAALDREASREDLRTAAITLSAQVATTWYQLAEQGTQLRVLNEQLVLNEQTLELVTLHFRRGQTSATDVLRQQQLVEATRGEMAVAESRRDVLTHSLALLLGEAPGTWVAPHSGDGLAMLPPMPATGLPADLVQRRPDVARAYLALLAADQRVAAAVAARFPRLSLSGQVSTSGEEVGDLFHNWLSNLAANLALPVIDGGQRRADVARAEAVAAERLHSYEQVVLGAIAEVESGLAQESQQSTYLMSLMAQLDLSRQVIERTRDSYTSGAAPYLQVLDVMRTHQKLERTVLTAARQLSTLRIDLYRALAGGWDMPEADGASGSGGS